jgi:hypothetical protein
VTALSDCVEQRRRRLAKRFLQGLSADELQYIAEFLGSCILESSSQPVASRGQVAEGITHFERCRHGRRPVTRDPVEDQDHKMILLLEYLCRCGLTRYSLVRAPQA